MPVSQAYQGIADMAFSGLKGEHPAPKAGALPTALHPVIQFIYPAGRILPKQAHSQLRSLCSKGEYPTDRVRQEQPEPSNKKAGSSA